MAKGGTGPQPSYIGCDMGQSLHRLARLESNHQSAHRPQEMKRSLKSLLLQDVSRVPPPRWFDMLRELRGESPKNPDLCVHPPKPLQEHLGLQSVPELTQSTELNKDEIQRRLQTNIPVDRQKPYNSLHKCVAQTTLV